jgi:hypothetical protein
MPGRNSVDQVPIDADPKKLRYLRWLTTPKANREPSSERQLADELKVSVKTLYNWRQQTEFRRRWEQETDTIIGGDDRRQAVFDALYETATDRTHKQHVQAAVAFTKLIAEIQLSVANLRQTDKPLSQLNAKELEAMIAAAAQEELATSEPH